MVTFLHRRSVAGFALAAVLAPLKPSRALGYQPSAANCAVLGSIGAAIAHARPVAQSFVHPPAFLGLVPQPSGPALLMFDSALELDTDGWAGDQHNPDWQKDTSLRYTDGKSLDANVVPYLVLPLPPSWSGRFGIALGDYAAVVSGGRLAFAVFGDRGPSRKLGEGSIALLRRLGQERVRPDGSVINAGTRPGIVTLVFPGSAAADDRTNQASLLSAIDTKGRALFTAAGGKNAI